LVREEGRKLWVSFRTRKHKYILHRLSRSNTETELLFDLRDDPGERRAALRRQAWGPAARVDKLENIKARLTQQNRSELDRRKLLPPAEAQEFEIPSDLRDSLRALGYVE
jgi:hypothetical protein